MFNWPLDSINWTYSLLAATGVSSLALRSLTKRAASPGNVGWIPDIIVPLLLAGAAILCLPELTAAFGLGHGRYESALHWLLPRAPWLGLLFDRSSWVQRTDRGLQGGRSGWPIRLLGVGLLLILLSPMVARYQNQVLEWINQGLILTDKDAKGAKSNVDLHQWPILVADWGRLVADGAVALALVGAFALAGQSASWVLRILHADWIGWADDHNADPKAQPGPGCFQASCGFLLGVAGAGFLAWSTYTLLQGG